VQHDLRSALPGALELRRIFVEQVDRGPLRLEDVTKDVTYAVQDRRQLDGIAERSARLANDPLVIVRLAVEVTIERQLNPHLERVEEDRHAETQQNLERGEPGPVAKDEITRDQKQHQDRSSNRERR
jgi:hypothetical protein